MNDVATESANEEVKGLEVESMSAQISRCLPIPMTDAQKLELGRDLAVKHSAIDAAALNVELENSRHKDAKKELDGAHQALVREASEVARQLRGGTIDKMVDCLETRDYRTGTVRVVRLDTNAEVSERPMTLSERQPDLPGVDRGDPVPAAEEKEEASASSDEADGDTAITDPEGLMNLADEPDEDEKPKRKKKKNGAS